MPLAIAVNKQQLLAVTLDNLDILDTTIEVRSERRVTATAAPVIAHVATFPITSVHIPLVTQPRIELVISLRVRIAATWAQVGTHELLDVTMLIHQGTTDDLTILDTHSQTPTEARVVHLVRMVIEVTATPVVGHARVGA